MKTGPRCEQCPLRNAPGPVWGVGRPSSLFAIVAQNPGPEEIKPDVMEPLVGASGRMANRGMFEVGLRREDGFLTNIVKCYVPPGSPIPKGAIECCKPLLQQELSCLTNLRVIITFGLESFNAMTGKHLYLQHSRKAAEKDPAYWLRGYPYRKSTLDSCPIIPFEHPASIMRGFMSTPYWQSDWRKAKRWVDGKGAIYEERYSDHPTDTEVIQTVEAILDLKHFGLDIETPDIPDEEEEQVAREKDMKIDTIGLSYAIGQCTEVMPHQFHLLNRLFEKGTGCTGYAYNWGFDGFHCAKHWDLSNIQWYDVMLAYNLLHSTSRPKDLGMALSVWTDIPYHKNLRKSQPGLYNARDTYGALWAGKESWDDLQNMGCGDTFWKQEMPLIPIVEDLRINGFKCDVAYAQRAELACYQQLAVYEKWWREHIPQYDWSAPKQLQELFAKMHMPVKLAQRTKQNKDGTKTKYKSPTVDEGALEEYRDKYGNKTAGLVLEMRRLKKAGDFTHIYQNDGRCHATYKIHGQKQGRVQAKDPDVQNIPEEAAGIRPRKICISDDNDSVLIVADSSQIELRVYAYCANDWSFLNMFAKGDYIYGAVYEEIYNEPFFIEGKPRTKKNMRPDIAPWQLLVVKSGPLGWIYGRGPESMINMGISKEKGKEFYDKLAREHHPVLEFHRRLEYEAQRSGYLRNLFGRIRRFPNVHGQRNEILSFPGQSNAADILRANALFKFAAGLKRFGARLIFTVHDSTGITCPKATAPDCTVFVKQCMEAPIPEMKGFSIPVEIKLGPNWDDTIAYEKWCQQQGITPAF